MEGDQGELVGGSIEECGDGAEDECVGEAVETVFTEVVTCGNGGGDWVGVDVRWDGGVKGGVETGDVFCCWREGREAGVDDG